MKKALVGLVALIGCGMSPERTINARVSGVQCHNYAVGYNSTHQGTVNIVDSNDLFTTRVEITDIGSCELLQSSIQNGDYIQVSGYVLRPGVLTTHSPFEIKKIDP